MSSSSSRSTRSFSQGDFSGTQGVPLEEMATETAILLREIEVMGEQSRNLMKTVPLLVEQFEKKLKEEEASRLAVQSELKEAQGKIDELIRKLQILSTENQRLESNQNGWDEYKQGSNPRAEAAEKEVEKLKAQLQEVGNNFKAHKDRTRALLEELVDNLMSRLQKREPGVVFSKGVNGNGFHKRVSLELKNKIGALDAAINDLDQAHDLEGIKKVFNDLLGSGSIKKSHTGIKRAFRAKSKTYYSIQDQAQALAFRTAAQAPQGNRSPDPNRVYVHPRF